MTCTCKEMCLKSKARSVAAPSESLSCRIDDGPHPYIAVEPMPGGFRPVMKAHNPETMAFEVMAWDQGIDRGWWEAHNRALDWAIQSKLELR